MDFPSTKNHGIYVVWRDYQRRAEVLGARIGAAVSFFPHRYSWRWLRPIDYMYAFFKTLAAIRRSHPSFVIFQSPPLFTALPARLSGVPYVIDAHNATFQSAWRKLPASKWLMVNAAAVLVHNEEIADLARRQFPEARLITLPDPVEPFALPSSPRVRNRILPICSFASDEPVEVLLEAMALARDLEFVITADPSKLTPSLASKLSRLENVKLTGFLPVKEYQELLSTSGAALVLTTRLHTQPSGACEALSSDTPLVVSKTTLTEALFGGWAYLTENEAPDIVKNLRTAVASECDLSAEREDWNKRVDNSIEKLALLVK